MPWLGWAVGLLLVGLWCGCQTGAPTNSTGAPTPQAAVAPSAAPGSPSADMLFTGNRIVITFSGLQNPPDPHEDQIREDGCITPPLLGRTVTAAGKTIGQLQEELHGLYVPGFFKAVTVTVRIADRYFFVGGQVKNPGQKAYLSEMTVLKGVQAAGDFTDFADKTKIQVTRTSGKTEIINGKKALKNPRLDLPIYPGDSIFVPQRFF
jgi:polysaccharide export outer membrane protein